MEPIHVLLGVESPLSLIMAVFEGKKEGVGRGVGGREGGAGWGAVPVLWAVAIALSYERMGLNRMKQETRRHEKNVKVSFISKLCHEFLANY